MRSRNIKPAFFKNELLAELPMATRLLFIGLWCLADRAGRLEDRPLRIKAEIFPYDSEDVPKHIGRLSDAGFLTRYQAGGVGYIEIANFARHQNPHKQESPSRIPPSSEGVRKSIGSPPADSLLSDSPSLIPEPLLPKGAFELVWKDYPRKLGKDDALLRFRSQVKTPEDFENIKKALANYNADIRKKGTAEDYILHGSTWFNKRWKDWIGYRGIELPSAPRPALIKRLPEIIPQESTPKEIKERHDIKLKNMGPCRGECPFCVKELPAIKQEVVK